MFSIFKLGCESICPLQGSKSPKSEKSVASTLASIPASTFPDSGRLGGDGHQAPVAGQRLRNAKASSHGL